MEWKWPWSSIASKPTLLTRAAALPNISTVCLISSRVIARGTTPPGKGTAEGASPTIGWRSPSPGIHWEPVEAARPTDNCTPIFAPAWWTASARENSPVQKQSSSALVIRMTPRTGNRAAATWVASTVTSPAPPLALAAYQAMVASLTSPHTPAILVPIEDMTIRFLSPKAPILPGAINFPN